MADPEAPRDHEDDGVGPFIEQVLHALEGRLGAEEQAALQARLAEDPDKRRLFVQLCLQSRTLSEVLSLHHRDVDTATDERGPLEGTLLGLVAAREGAGALAGPGRRDGDAVPSRRPWLRGMIAAAAVLVVGVGVGVGGGLAVLKHDGPRGRRQAPVAERPYPRVDLEGGLAMVVKLDGVRWERADEPHPSEGDLLAPGRLRFLSGRATLSMLSGVVLVVEGPADLDLVSIDRVFCRQGKLRARVPGGADGFVISSPESSVLDLGTEFGLNVEDGGASRVKVFEGAAEAMVHSREGSQTLSQLVLKSREFELDPKAGRIGAAKGPGSFVAPADLPRPSLVLDASYPGAILAARPWSYWRFESPQGGAIPNEVPDRPPLRAHGPIRLAGIPGDNQGAEFPAGEPEQYLTLDGSWEPRLRPGYAVELWFLPESIDHAALVSMPAPKDTNNHFLILEMSSRNRHALHPPASVRFLDRWPPSMGGGCNIYSRRPYVPYRWHHLVGQVNGGRMELYLDGEPMYSSQVDIDHPSVPCQFLLGRLSTIPIDDWLHNRAFVGRLDEVALYDHPLSIEEIRSHRRLATQRVGDLRPAGADREGGPGAARATVEGEARRPRVREP
jgi:hypothetical protein